MDDKVIALIDEGGVVDATMKTSKKRLDVIKTQLRVICKEQEIALVDRPNYLFKAGDYVASAVDKSATIASYIGIRPENIKRGEYITLSTDQLLDMMEAAEFAIKKLDEFFTKETMSAIVTTTKTPFYTLSWTKKS
jgi:hypothetical protein